MRKPNILWIMTDQQSAHMMSCAGNPHVSTPNMDRIANAGVRFTKTYCTNPVCLPARFSLLTGLYPGDAAVRSNDFWRESPGLPDEVEKNGLGTLLKNGGYNAVYGGKEHFPFTTATALGFDNLCKDERDELADNFADYLQNYRDDKPFAMVASFINPHDICYMAILDAAGHDGKGIFPAEALAQAKAEVDTCREAEKLPVGMSEEEFFATVCPPLPSNYLPAADEPEAISILQEERSFKQRAREQYSDERWRIHRWAYKTLTEKVDGQIGKLLDALEKSGRWDDTVIIFTSDHGDMDASHKMEHKECLYEECCRVPLLIKGVGGADGELETGLVCNGLDLFPTILDYAGIKAPDYLEGFSLKGRAQGTQELTVRENLVVECENGIMAVDKHGKYVRYDRGARAEQFYDLGENPGEMYDQLADPRFASRVAALGRALDSHLDTRTARFGIGALSTDPEAVRYTPQMLLGNLLSDEKAVEMLEKRKPGITKNPMYAMAGGMPVIVVLSGLSGEDRHVYETVLGELRTQYNS